MCNERYDICEDCGSDNISAEATPFNDEDGPRIVMVYRCRDCGVLSVPDFEVAA